MYSILSEEMPPVPKIIKIVDKAQTVVNANQGQPGVEAEQLAEKLWPQVGDETTAVGLFYSANDAKSHILISCIF